MQPRDVEAPSYEQCQKYLTRVKPYLRLGEFIKAGGAGVVYNLEGTSRPCVAKFIDTRFMANRAGNKSSDKEVRKKCCNYIQSEIEMMKSLRDCDRVMPLYGSYTFSNVDGNDASNYVSVTLLIMPKMCSLMEYIKKQKTLTESDILQLGLDMAEALQACERQNILHRDLKPDNIFVTRQDGKLRFVLGDFGASRRLHKLGEEVVTRIGTNRYMAPEIKDYATLRSLNADIYSLGVTLFYLLTNEYPEVYKDPRTGRSRVCMWHHMIPEFKPILENALQREPDFRYHDADVLLADLGKLRLARHGNVIRDPFAMAAKEALCSGRETEALEIARNGYLQGERACRRLLAYCMHRRNFQDERVLELLNESFYEDDPTGILIRGMYFASIGDTANAGQDFKDAAENKRKCVLAWYYYGKFLYSGVFPGIQQNQEEGLLYIQKAAEEKFYPALRIMKRIRQQRPGLNLPEELEELMHQEYSKDDPMEENDIIKYL